MFSTVLCTLLILCVILYSYPFESHENTFYASRLFIPTGSSTQKPLDFTVSFTLQRDIHPHEHIGVILPRFTRRLENNTLPIISNQTLYNVLISPSYLYSAEWMEGFSLTGADGDGVPYVDSMLLVRSALNETLTASSSISITVFKENKIGATCGFPPSTVPVNSVASFSPFRLVTVRDGLVHTIKKVLEQFSVKYPNGSIAYNYTAAVNVTGFRNVTLRQNTSHNIDVYSGLGNGCSNLNNCNGRGICDYCYEICKCYDGFGSSTDLIQVGSPISPDCSQRICPAGRAIGDVPSSSDTAHTLAECSNYGNCDRATGVCRCFPPFIGGACERSSCPNNCSMNGQCVSIYELSLLQQQDVPSRVSFVYGTGGAINTKAWDYQTMYGCVCDSSWAVGFAAGETQLPEFFGPDCSLRHCPSGDDPYTGTDETDCHGVSQYATPTTPKPYVVGLKGNKCHVDCSNRGICNYQTGRCKCFEGSWGDACENMSNTGDSKKTVLTFVGNKTEASYATVVTEQN